MIMHIYKRFFKIGTLLLGGGYVILPLLQSEIGAKFNQISDDDICEYYAISQSLPGIIAINTAVLVGYKLAKTKGAIASITGIVTPAFLAIILLANLIAQIIHYPLIQATFIGIGIGVLALLFQATREIWNKCILDKTSFVIFLFAFIALFVLKISPVHIVITGVILGIIRGFINSKKEAKE